MYLLHIVKIHGTVSCDLCLLGCVCGISHMHIRGLPKAMRLNKSLQSADIKSTEPKDRKQCQISASKIQI